MTVTSKNGSITVYLVGVLVTINLAISGWSLNKLVQLSERVASIEAKVGK